MPVSRLISSILLRLSSSSMPSTLTDPLWNSSSLLMHRISVDLPDPEGPQTMTFSPAPTSRSMLFNA